MPNSCVRLMKPVSTVMTTVLAVHVLSKMWPEKIEERRKYADYEIDELGELLKE